MNLLASSLNAPDNQQRTLPYLFFLIKVWTSPHTACSLGIVLLAIPLLFAQTFFLFSSTALWSHVSPILKGTPYIDEAFIFSITCLFFCFLKGGKYFTTNFQQLNLGKNISFRTDFYFWYLNIFILYYFYKNYILKV